MRHQENANTDRHKKGYIFRVSVIHNTALKFNCKRREKGKKYTFDPTEWLYSREVGLDHYCKATLRIQRVID